MIKVKGKYAEAKIFNDYVEESALQQIYAILNHPIADGSKIRFQPDVHAGAGAVIGTTMTLTDKIIPNFIGVDIACGVTAWNLGVIDIDFEKFHNVIETNVPSGRNARETMIGKSFIRDIYNKEGMNEIQPYKEYIKSIELLCKKMHSNTEYVLKSLGTLGGGRMIASSPSVK